MIFEPSSVTSPVTTPEIVFPVYENSFTLEIDPCVERKRRKEGMEGWDGKGGVQYMWIIQ